MSVVKFNAEKQKKVKTLSKVIYILARIGKICAMIGVVALMLCAICVPVVGYNTKIENKTIEVFGEKMTYEQDDNNIVLSYEEETDRVELKNAEDAQKVVDMIDSASVLKITLFVEIVLVTLICILILVNRTLEYLDKLFVNIYNEETPFTLDNVVYIKKMAYFMIAIIIVPLVMDIVSNLAFGLELDIELKTVDIIEILFLYGMSYVFEYGCELQKNSKSKMLGEVDE